MAIQSKLISIEKYLDMAERGVLTEHDRVELIRGVIVEKMTINLPHITCVARLQSLFLRRLNVNATVTTQSAVRVPPNSVPEPDITLLKYPAAEDVLLLIEVSDTTLDYDRNVKMPLYTEGGVPEYWIVNIQEAKVAR